MSGGSRLTLILTLKVGLWGPTTEPEEEAVPASVNYHQTVMLCLPAALAQLVRSSRALSARLCLL